MPVALQAGRVGTLLAAALLASACGGGQPERTLVEVGGSTMGTAYTVKLVASGEGHPDAGLRSTVQAELDAVEQSMSTYIDESELSRFNAHRDTGWYPVSEELCRLVTTALEISERTDGAFDVTVGPLVNLWGFGPSGAVAEPPAAEAIASALEATGYRKLHADCERPALRKEHVGLYVDLSALAKGYAVDRVADRLDGLRIGDYLVEVGGEIRVRGRNAKGADWTIAIETPRAAGRSVHSIVGLSEKGVATSGDYRNFFEYEGRIYSHTIDPRTGYPVAHAAASVTVVAETAALADAMATALLVLGPDAGLPVAEEQELAVYYLVRVGDSFQARASRLFATAVASR